MSKRASHTKSKRQTKAKAKSKPKAKTKPISPEHSRKIALTAIAAMPPACQKEAMSRLDSKRTPVSAYDLPKSERPYALVLKANGFAYRPMEPVMRLSPCHGMNAQRVVSLALGLKAGASGQQINLALSARDKVRAIARANKAKADHLRRLNAKKVKAAKPAKPATPKVVLETPKPATIQPKVVVLETPKPPVPVLVPQETATAGIPG